MNNQSDESEIFSKIIEESLVNNDIKKTTLDLLAQLIDCCLNDKNETGLLRSLELTNSLKNAKNISPEHLTELYYYEANIWDGISSLRNQKSTLSWENKYLENEIINLRKARISEGFRKNPIFRKITILTNLASKFSEAGRPIEALKVYDTILRFYPKYGMALGGKGVCLEKYASHQHNKTDSLLLYQEAFKYLSLASISKSTESQARPYFEHLAKYLESNLSKIKPIKTNKPRLKNEDSHYQKWCFKERLFLNSLNDINVGNRSFGDNLGMSEITTKAVDGPLVPLHFKFYNLLKQEYVAARYMLYDGLTSDDNDFSNNGIMLYDTLDYPKHSLNLEKIKFSYRSAYSLLDKIANFINFHMKLNIDPKKVQFRTIWFEKKQLIRVPFKESKNWPMRGLFWLSKDLHDDSPEFIDSIDPGSKLLHEIRNFLEHKFLDHSLVPSNKSSAVIYHIEEAELRLKALKVMGLARESLVYLFLAIRVEEYWKAKRDENENTNEKASFRAIMNVYPL
jgi:hypothetical protein